MKGLGPILVALIAMQCAIVCGGTNESIDFSRINSAHLPFSFEVRRFLGTVNQFSAADIDGDEVDEIIATILKQPGSPAPYAVEVDGIGLNEVLFRHNFNYPAIPSSIVADVEDRDGKNEIFVQEMKPDGVLFHILNAKGETAYSLEAAHKPPGADKNWECGVSAEAAIDVNRDGYQDLVVMIYTTYGYQPRELRLLDVRNRRWLWSYKVGFGFSNLVLADVNSDGSREIILGSTSPGNIEGSRGRSVNGTDDLHIYLTVLDSLGRRIRCQQVGGVFEGVSVFARDINGDGKPEVLTQSDCHNKSKISGRIALWNPVTGVLGPEIAFEKTPAKTLAFLDADRDGKTDFAAGWDDGTVEIYNSRFEMLSSVRFAGFNVQNLKVSDLNRDGEEDLLVAGLVRDEYRIIALDRKLRLLAVYDKNAGFDPYAGCIVNPGFGEDKLLIAQGFKGASSCLLSLERNVLPAIEIPWMWLGWGALAGMLAAGGFFVIRSRRRETECASISNMANSIHMGLFILDADGRLLFMNREMERSLGGRRLNRENRPFADVLKETPYEPVIQIIRGALQKNRHSVEEETRMRDTSGEYREILVSVSPISLSASRAGGRLVLIQNITDMAESKRAAVWASIAQRLAHEIKTPLSSVMLSAQRIRMECEENPEELKRYEKYIGHITGQVDRLRKMTDAFMKFARVEKPQLSPCDVKEILQEVISESRLKMGSGVQVKIQWDQELPRISADRQQLSVAFQNLVDNSLNAMEGKGVLTIAARLVQTLYNNHNHGLKDGIQIELSDTGKGISPNHQARLFQPFFSKSASGTGLGLVIVKKIVEDHHGSIRIESEEGIGTTVFITLPINNGKKA